MHIRAETCLASISVRTVLLLSELAWVQLMEGQCPLVDLISLFALATTKLTAKLILCL